MPIFWAASRKPSRAVASSTPSISYMMRPGLTTATQNSGLPLPLPIRVSAGFLVTGLSGKIRMKIFPPRFTLPPHHTPAPPELGFAFPLAHPGRGRLLGHRLVREDPDEDLPAPLHAARQRHPGRLDLAVRHPAGLERLEPIIAERQGRAALGLALHAAALGLAVLDALGHQHGFTPRSRAGRAAPRP